MSRPTLWIGIIARNEERDIPRCIASIRDLADGLVLVDTGSTDNTIDVAISAWNSGKPIRYFTYTDASEKDVAGNWRLCDFSKARNQTIERAEKEGADWYLWMDADDELLSPEAYRRAMYRGDVDTFAVTIDSGGSQWAHQRLWRASKKVRFKGRCHEFPIIDNCRVDTLNAIIRHHQDADASQEDSNARNLRILMREWEEGPNERTAFYIANTHRDAGRWDDAVEWYAKRVGYGQQVFRDEYLFARLYFARALLNRNAVGDRLDAAKYLDMSDELAPDWCEFEMQRARIAYDNKAYKKAIELALPCVDAPIPPTTLWRERSDYTDGPCRLISWCYEHLGKIGKAMQWAVLAQDRIGKPDAEWDARVASLKAKVLKAASTRGVTVRPSKEGGTRSDAAPAIVTRRRESIALVRPGAIGDVLMTLNLLPAFKEANPDAEVHYFTDIAELENIIIQAGATRVTPTGYLGNSKGFDRTIHLVGYPLSEGYPEKPMRQHLLHYFADELGLPVINKDMIGCYAMEMHRSPAGLPSLELPLPARPKCVEGIGEYVTLQRNAKWSKYKTWTQSWNDIIFAFPDIRFEEIDESRGMSLADSIALFANAKAHIGVDSFCGHLSNYFWKSGNSAKRVRALILWGSTQPSAAGYPHNINLSAGLHCQPCFRESPKLSVSPRGPCINPVRATYDDDTPWQCMQNITTDEVIEGVRKLWADSSQ